MSRVAIIGAGAAGVVHAKVLSRVGHDVVVYDKTPDVGGVWSATRRYPGVTTQSPKDTYSFSELPMPKDYPEWPDGEQVQAYFASYAAEFGVNDLLRLSTEVTSAVPRPDGTGWTLTVRSADGTTSTDEVDHLVVANGVFSDPLRPSYAGEDEFASAGGTLVTANEFTDVEAARGKRVVVVGYGKSSCDVAQEVSAVASSTDVIARQLLWKVPRKIHGFLNFKFLLLTRMGEALFRWQHLRGMERFLHGPGNGLRRKMLNGLGDVSVKQYDLEKLDLVPRGQMEDIVRGAIGLVTDGFYESVAAGAIAVRRDRMITRLLAVDGVPHVELDDGTRLPADLVVCATGYRQDLPFFDDALKARLTDERGNFMLYRQVLPVDVPNLTFGGYNSSFFSPLNAEMGALWTASHLAGRIELPEPAALRTQVEGRIAFMDDATSTHHCKGTKIIPFSMHNVDELLADVGTDVSRGTRANHWLNPVNAKAYRKVTQTVEKQLAGTGITVPTSTRAERPAARS